MRTIVPILCLSVLPILIYGRTIEITTEICFANPALPNRVDGAQITSVVEPGRKQCFFQPDTGAAYYAVRINQLNLERQDNVCPTLHLSLYTGTRQQAIQNEFEKEVAPMTIMVPTGEVALFSADCTNYLDKIGTVIQSTGAGQYFQMIYDPLYKSAPPKAYNMTFTSYMQGSSWQCDAGFFRCWQDKYKCIGSSMECDFVDNCFDGSDEDPYLCTGRIGGIPVGLFVIIILMAFIVFICLCVALVFCIRRRRTNKLKMQETWVDMNMRPEFKDNHDGMLTYLDQASTLSPQM